MTSKQNWYSNKELFEMLEAWKDDIVNLRLEMKETKTVIRDYNGLRKSINDANKEIVEIKEEINKELSEIKVEIKELKSAVETHKDNRKEYIGYIIAAISTLFLLLNYFK